MTMFVELKSKLGQMLAFYLKSPHRDPAEEGNCRK